MAKRKNNPSRTPPDIFDEPWPLGLKLDAVEVIDKVNPSRVIYWRADGSGLHELERALQQYGDQPDHYVVQGVTHDGRVLVDNQGGAGGDIRWMAKSANPHPDELVHEWVRSPEGFKKLKNKLLK